MDDALKMKAKLDLDNYEHLIRENSRLEHELHELKKYNIVFYVREWSRIRQVLHSLQLLLIDYPIWGQKQWREKVKALIKQGLSPDSTPPDGTKPH
jgi:hypothetical protein